MHLMKTIRVFVYGSLLNKESLKETAPQAKILGVRKLLGYKRVLNKPSKRRGCAMNIQEQEQTEVLGVLIQVSTEEYEEIRKREVLYTEKEITLSDKTTVKTFIYLQEPETFNIQDPKQQEYLKICWQGAQQHTQELKENFQETTTQQNTSIKKHLFK
ncbi:MAG: gamma-glutamylcyclotransferase family protein [Candidatus Woesearchaeota archaeon]